jgi:hypothetical protein
LNCRVLGILVALVVVVVLVALAMRAYLRRGGDEANSVDDYRHTLHTLSDIRSKSATRTVRVIGAEEAGPGDGEVGAAEAPVFEDAGLRAPLTTPRTGRHDRAMSAMNRRPRRMGAPVAVGVVVLAVLAGVVVVGARSRHHTPTHSADVPASTTAVTSHHSTPPANRTTSTTTTTVPTRFLPADASSLSATYRPPANVYSVTLAAGTSQCWVTVSSATGASLLSTTLSPGEKKTLSVTGGAKVVIGAPSALTVTLDHEPVVLPTGYGTPFTMTLQPATA